jgi:CRP/FNR family transcriptional regulator, cyclic AMP receptor protein
MSIMHEKTNSLWGNIFKSCQKEGNAVSDVLKKIPMFGNLKNRELLQIERILHRREYHANEAVFFEGDPGLGMYIIEDGIVDIVSGSVRQPLADLQHGEFFGELSLLDDAPRTASAIARTPCKLLCFFQPDLFDLLGRNPRLGVKILLNLASVIGERLKKANETMQELKRNMKGQDSH